MSQNKSRIFRDEFEALGTKIVLHVVVKSEQEFGKARIDAKKVRELYEYFTKIFSRFDKESELSKLNNDLGKFQKVSPEMLRLAEKILKHHKETLGFFEPRILETMENIGYSQDFSKGIKMIGNLNNENFAELAEDLKVENEKIYFGRRMDFSGIAKGFINDEIVIFLREKGWKNFLVDSGGDMYASGVDENGEKWTVDVEGINYGKLMFALSDLAIATSGIGKRKWEIEGKRFHHIINPKKSLDFSFELKSVSVIADSTTKADVWAKTLFLMGREDGIIYAGEHNLKAVFLAYRGGAWISPKVKELLYKKHE